MAKLFRYHLWWSIRILILIVAAISWAAFAYIFDKEKNVFAVIHIGAVLILWLLVWRVRLSIEGLAEGRYKPLVISILIVIFLVIAGIFWKTTLIILGVAFFLLLAYAFRDGGGYRRSGRRSYKTRSKKYSSRSHGRKPRSKGIYTDSKGYKRFKDSGKLVHRWAAEKKMGGKIRPGYDVHHKDGDKGNFRKENLWTMKHSDHARHHARERKRKKR